MGIIGSVGDQLRKYLRAERERREWTQSYLADLMEARGFSMHWTTIAKIEKGDRAVRADELGAFADLFEVSADALLGRASNGGDVVWAVSKLTTNAQRAVAELSALHTRLGGDTEDLRYYAQREGRETSAERLSDLAAGALEDVATARDSVAAVGAQFPLPGVKSR